MLMIGLHYKNLIKKLEKGRHKFTIKIVEIHNDKSGLVIGFDD